METLSTYLVLWNGIQRPPVDFSDGDLVMQSLLLDYSQPEQVLYEQPSNRWNKTPLKHVTSTECNKNVCSEGDTANITTYVIYFVWKPNTV